MARFKTATKVSMKDTYTEEEIRTANSAVIAKIKANYNNKDITPLTLHNSVHSFESFFSQYSEYLKIAPIVVLEIGQIAFRWGDKLEIRGQGPRFRATFPSKAYSPSIESTRRDELMRAIERQFDHKFPIPPC